MSDNPYAAPATRASEIAAHEEPIPAPLTLVRKAIAVDWLLLTTWLVWTMPRPLSRIFQTDHPSKTELMTAHHPLLDPVDVFSFYLGLLIATCLAGVFVLRGRSPGARIYGIKQAKLVPAKGLFWRAAVVRVLAPLGVWAAFVTALETTTLDARLAGAVIISALVVATTSSASIRDQIDRLAGTRFIQDR